MKAKERDARRRELRTPDANGIYHYPLPHSFFVRMINGLPEPQRRQYWRPFDRKYLEGQQLSAKQE
jgi:hypothetical protein